MTDPTAVHVRVRRAARRILSQHQQLESFYGMVAEAMADGDERETQTRLARFRDALDAHFSLEERVCFPALARTRPGLSRQIAALERDHKWLREELDQVRKRLDASELEASAARFDSLAAELARHDSREEQLVGRILRLASHGTRAVRLAAATRPRGLGP